MYKKNCYNAPDDSDSDAFYSFQYFDYEVFKPDPNNPKKKERRATSDIKTTTYRDCRPKKDTSSDYTKVDDKFKKGKSTRPNTLPADPADCASILLISLFIPD